MNRSLLADPSYKSLEAYLSSLGRVLGLDVNLALPGHGPPIEDIQGLIEGYREHHRARTEEVARALGKGPKTVYELSFDVFPSLNESEVSLAVSEIVVHLEPLLESGRARIVDTGPPILYAGS